MIPLLLRYIEQKTRHWESLTEEERKVWNNFIILRWLSMNEDLLPILNDLQHITIYMGKRECYEMLYNLLPKGKITLHYVKRTKPNKETDKAYKLLADLLEISSKEAKEYFPYLNREQKKRLTEQIKQI